MSVISIDLRKKLPMYDNKAEKLKGGVCEEILPLSTIKYRRIVRGIYHTEGYRKLSEFSNLSVSEALSAVESVLELREKLRDNLFFPDEYILSADTIFVDEKLERFRLAYIPVAEIGNPEAGRAEKSFACFIASLKRQTSEAGAEYLDRLSDFLMGAGANAEIAISFAERLKQEARTFGIN